MESITVQAGPVLLRDFIMEPRNGEWLLRRRTGPYEPWPGVSVFLTRKSGEFAYAYEEQQSDLRHP